ncbi:hypothetical protein FPHYL_9945 [Fusarium phyllophilum]|uniref:Uncharacterized protein n=1 Tax=Fusarium phyllophilum TaxID=47803 RepID=A0A8H5J6E1_9HYPO|nr:hypothetical protein FPHYL_9945 [Fusarium phyllophilum]
MSSVTTPLNFNHSSIDVRNIDARRAYMKAFFLHLGLWDEEKVKTYREFSEEQGCDLVYNAGHSQVNHVFFEFLVDTIVWHNILRTGSALGQGHDWPWTPDALPDKTDVTTDGASECYREWRDRKMSAMQQIIATGQIINLKDLHWYGFIIPTETRVECLFGPASTQFPHHDIKSLTIAEVERHVVAILQGAFPSRTQFYTTDEILLRTNYRLIQG